MSRDLAAWRQELCRARNGARLLDLLISPRDAAERIGSLPVEDFHHYVRQIGLAESTDLLAMATPEQVRACFDIESWDRDDLVAERMDPWLRALLAAGPDVLGRNLLGLDDELVNWVVRRSVEVWLLEDPEDFQAPDLEHIVTPDGRMCIVFRESADRDIPVKVFLDWLMQEDPAFWYNLLVFSAAALDSNLVEQAHRWRTGRMADLGYVDYYEALRVYTPPPKDPVVDALPDRDRDPVEPPTHWLTDAIDPDDRLAAAIARLDAKSRDSFSQGLAYLINAAMSADRIEPWDDERRHEVVQRVQAGLVLGLDAMAGGDLGDAQVLASVPTTLIFRTGYARMLAAAKPLRHALDSRLLRGPGGRVDGVDLETLGPWAESLASRHPCRPDGAPLRTAHDLAIAETAAKHIAELARIGGRDRPEAIGLGRWITTVLTRDVIGIGGVGPLPEADVERAHEAMFGGGRLRPEAKAAAADFWAAHRGGEGSLRVLLDELEDRLAGADPSDPRFLDLWWIEA